ncbi:MAG: regulatory protein RecX [Betaproteobacteria bacterium]
MANAPKPTNREIVSASLRLLAMRDMSRAEFERKLAAKEFTPEEIAEAVVWCEAEGWLNEARYAEVVARRLGYRYGASRISQTLKQKGVPDEVVAAAVGEMKDTEVARAREVLARKFGEAPVDAASRAKQIRYMQARGFGYEAIKKAFVADRDD